MSKGKKNKKIKVDLTYNFSEKGNFGLSRALQMLIPGETLRSYLSKKKLITNKYDRENP